VGALVVIVLIFLVLGTAIAVWELGVFIFIPFLGGLLFMIILSDVDINPMPMLIPLFGPLLLRLGFQYIRKKQAKEKQRIEREAQRIEQEKREREQWERDIDSKIDNIFR
jgi:hypothetical protein